MMTHYLIVGLAVAAIGCHTERGRDYSRAESEPFVFVEVATGQQDWITHHYEQLRADVAFAIPPGQTILIQGFGEAGVSTTDYIRTGEGYLVACPWRVGQCWAPLGRLYADLIAGPSSSASEVMRLGLADVVIGGIGDPGVRDRIEIDRTLIDAEGASELLLLVDDPEPEIRTLARHTAADFVGFMIRKYGWRDFLEVYRSPRSVDEELRIRGSSLSEYLADWHSSPPPTSRAWIWTGDVCSRPVSSPNIAVTEPLVTRNYVHAPTVGRHWMLTARTIELETESTLSVAVDAEGGMSAVAAIQACEKDGSSIARYWGPPRFTIEPQVRGSALLPAGRYALLFGVKGSLPLDGSTPEVSMHWSAE